ncbi:MAG: YiiG family protein [Lachnospiraceae bacterium]|jgi:hypothetical protein|nr:YiiG family protein [Lachnospiraceae bacterium]
MKRKALLIGCATAAAVIMAGCGGKASDTAVTTEAASEGTAGVSEEETVDEAALEELEGDLYNAYIEINNDMVDRFDEVIASYFKYVDFQEEFTLLDDDYWCLSMTSSFYDQMETANELLSQKQEKDELDQSFLALYPVMKELAETLDEVYDYTDLESYKDDEYAKGKELHAVIWKDYEEYETLGQDFLDKLGAKADQQNTENLEKLKEEGLEATYAFNVLINTAQEIQSAIYDQEIDDSQVINLDIEALQPLYDQYVENVQTCLDYLADEDAMYKEGYPTNSAYYHSFESSIRDSKKDLTDLFERVRNQEAVDEFHLDFAFPDDGTIRKFEDSISAIIDDYNKLISY